MSFTVVKKADGLSVIVNNTLLDAGAGNQVVSDDVLEADGITTDTVFGATAPVTPIKILNFKVFDNRIHKV